MRDSGVDGSLQNAISVEALTYRVNDTDLIDINHLTFGQEGATAVMGPNGAGKSLFLRLLHGLVEPSKGSITFSGEPQLPHHRRTQSLVFQKPVLLRRSTEANISFVLRARGLDPLNSAGLLARVGLADKARSPARRLSGGEQQRLAMARALATNPDTLFLDEPTASLDPTSAKVIEDIVTETMSDGVRTVFVTHDAAQARRLARDVVFLHRGRLVEHTPAETFFENPKTDVARAYLSGKLNQLAEP